MICKSNQDDCKYEYLQLKNGVKVIYISDINADRSACAVSIKTGSYDDPNDYSGLAHFLEHMLFMGTEKYPSENEFFDYISKYGGESNAYTDNKLTLYYFDILHRKFKGALDRFSYFFKKPLFIENTVDREIMAVDSEFKKGLSSESYRIRRMLEICYHPDLPESNFTVGNLETLKKPQIRNKLIEFWSQNYHTADISVCLYAKESPEVLKNMAIEMFKDVINNKNNCNNQKILYDNFKIMEKYPFKPEFCNRIIKIKPLKDISKLQINIILPSEYLYLDINPYEFIEYLLIKEEQGSLINILKNKGYSFGLDIDYESLDSYTHFSISVCLTSKGCKNYFEVIKEIYFYLKNLKISEDDYTDLKNIRNIEFTFLEKNHPIEHVENICRALQYVPYGNVLNYKYLFKKFDKKFLLDLIGLMCSQEKWLVFLINQNGKFDEVENIYNIQYDLGEFLPSLGEKISEIIPCDSYKCDVLKIEDLLMEKSMVKNRSYKNENGILNYYFSEEFPIPKTHIMVLLKNEEINRNIVQIKVFLEMFEEKFVQKYDGFLKKSLLNFQINSISEGIEIIFTGFNKKLPDLIEIFFDEFISNSWCDENMFQTVKESLNENYISEIYDMPYRRINQGFKQIFEPNFITSEEKMEILEKMDLNEIKIPKKYWAEVFVCGTLCYEDGLKVFNKITGVFENSKNFEQKIKEENIKIHLKSNDELNKACAVFLKASIKPTYHDLASLHFIYQIGHEKFFDTLRTKETLGYVVSSSITNFLGASFLQFIVQSEKDTGFLTKRIFSFIDDLHEYIMKMKDAEFQLFKTTLIEYYEEKFKNLDELSTFFWNLSKRNFLDWDFKDKIKEIIFKLSKIDLYNHSVWKDRAIVCVESKGNENNN
ncbi:metalloprotease [Hamiltosporidium tvaerminnensis]|nr:metalloprotease [Hamiltosporidium tvaerminnensis]